VRLAEHLVPDVLLLDLQMPGLDGAAVLNRLREVGSEAQTIVFTAYDTDERILAALRAGARGYLLKDASRTEIFDAVRTVDSGGSRLGSIVTSRLPEHIEKGQPNKLTPRELEVLALLARGRKRRDR
jgi:DNA-binding NarL/FixJ family response regulator